MKSNLSINNLRIKGAVAAFFMCQFFIIEAQLIDLNNGLQVFYPFTGNSLDYSGYGRHGSAFGGATLTTDRFGNANSAYYFDGINSFISANSSFDYPNKTISLWVRPLSIFGSGSTINVALVEDHNGLIYGNSIASFANGSAHLTAGGNSSKYEQTNIVPGTWYHLVIVRSQNTSRYYINGKLVSSGLITSTLTSNTGNSYMIIGAGRTTSNQYFQGSIDEVRVYNRAVNECEVVALYTGSKSIDLVNDLSAHYDFYNNANDASGNGHHLTVYGSPQPTTDRFGYSNSAYYFDGIDDYMNSFHSFDFVERSISLWVQPTGSASMSTSQQTAVVQDDYTLNYGTLQISIASGQFQLTSAGMATQHNISPIPVENWTHLVATRDAQTVKYYVNGNLVADHYAPTNGGSVLNPNSNLVIGSGRTMNSQFFNGKIDDIRIYSRSLNLCEVDSLYRMPYLHLGDSESDNVKLVCFPNPSNGSLSVVLPEIALAQSSNLMVINAVGQVVRSLNGIDLNEKIEFTGIPSGLYLVVLKTPSSTITEKVTVQPLD